MALPPHCPAPLIVIAALLVSRSASAPADGAAFGAGHAGCRPGLGLGPSERAPRPTTRLSLLQDATPASAADAPKLGGAASPAGGGRDVPSLKEWAEASGIRLGDGAALVQHGVDSDGDWGVRLASSGRSGGRAGDTVLRVPADLVLSSTDAPRALAAAPGGWADAVGILESAGLAEYEPEFVLVVRVLEELALGPSGRWYGWIRSIPTEFSTGLYMDDVERSFVRRFASEFMDMQERQLEAFSLAIQSLRESSDAAGSVDIKGLLSGDGDVIRWAYSIVFTRGWRSKSRNNVAAIVPLGDMFNHRHPANVVVEECDTSINAVLQEDADEDEPLYLSYGIGHLPARFLVTFGFFDASCPSIFSNVTFVNVTTEIVEMGFTDWTKMTFRVQDGAVANSVWDAVLYQILGSGDSARPSEQQKELYNTLLEDDWATIDKMHLRYGLQVGRALRQHVQQMLTSTYLNDLISQDCTYAQHPRLEMIVRYNSWMRTVLQRVKAHIDETIEAMSIR